MRTAVYKGVKILLVEANLAFINKPGDVLRLGIFAGYPLSKMKELIDLKKGGEDDK